MLIEWSAMAAAPLLAGWGAYVVASEDFDFSAKLLATSPAISAPVAFHQGFAISSLQPIPAMPPLPPSSLNAFADIDPEQSFTLAVSKAANPGVDFRKVTDVVLAIEYESSLA